MRSTSTEADAPHGGAGPAFDRRRLGAAVAWAALIALAARLQFPLPGTDIPQTAQTLAVLLAGGFLGFAPATVAIVVYLVAGAIGLPVFADGEGGVGVLLGPTGGYLVGFWFAAALMGYAADHGALRRPLALIAAALGAHALILAVGALLLAARVGFVAAWFNGVAPFLAGALVKSLAAAVILFAAGRIVGSRRRPA